MRIVGDWTDKVYHFLNPNHQIGLVQKNLSTDKKGRPIFLIDGPFGAASQEVHLSLFVGEFIVLTSDHSFRHSDALVRGHRCDAFRIDFEKHSL